MHVHHTRPPMEGGPAQPRLMVRPLLVRLRLAGLCLAGLVALGLAMAAPVSAEEIEIRIDNFAFVPETVTVKAGTVIKWINRDDIPHSIVGSAGQFRSRALDTDEGYSIAATTPGVVDYYCGLHPHMRGKVVVMP